MINCSECPCIVFSLNDNPPNSYFCGITYWKMKLYSTLYGELLSANNCCPLKRIELKMEEYLNRWSLTYDHPLPSKRQGHIAGI